MIVAIVVTTTSVNRRGR
jgi:hypothetical protein